MVTQVWKGMNGHYGEVEQKGPGWDQMRRYRSVIDGLTTEPEKVHVGARWTYELPLMARDMDVIVYDR
jgi:hypothetical protein